jgi:uncharacterized protein YcgI (DUF1989 family)
MTACSIEPQSGCAFVLRQGQTLRVIDPRGEQASDLTAFSLGSPRSGLSAGKTVEFAETIFLTTGHILYSSLSESMLEIVGDLVGRHNILLAPCSQETFDLLYPGRSGYHPSCFENLHRALAVHGVRRNEICSTFNIFMNVEIEATGRVRLRPAPSRPGNRIELRALMDLVVGLTACPAKQSNSYAFKPIHYEIFEEAHSDGGR